MIAFALFVHALALLTPPMALPNMPGTIVPVQEAGDPDPKQNEEVRYAVGHLQKAWGIEPARLYAGWTTVGHEAEITLTLRFTKDLRDPYDREEMRHALRGFTKPLTGQQLDTLPLVFHLFDGKNVSLAKVAVYKVEGELTGIKGDAFRVVLRYDKAKVANDSRVEARLKANP